MTVHRPCCRNVEMSVIRVQIQSETYLAPEISEKGLHLYANLTKGLCSLLLMLPKMSILDSHKIVHIEAQWMPSETSFGNIFQKMFFCPSAVESLLHADP